jgi:osmoprotectant transport system permease protein
LSPTFIKMLGTRSPELFARVLEHLELAGIATLIAVAIGIPMGIFALRSNSMRSILLGATSVVQTIPSLALLTFLLPFFGIGATPAIIALILYALLPIVRNTYAGLSGTPAPMLEMADALGLTRGQRLWMIESRFAAPVIMAGIRTAVTVSIGVATLSAFVGAGGLGAFINRGLSLNNMNLVLLGAVPAGLLALYADWFLGVFEHGLQPDRNRKVVRIQGGTCLAIGATAFGGLWMAARAHAVPSNGSVSAGTIVVGSKNFTEQYILAEIIAQSIEAKTDLAVERKLDLAGTAVCQQALLKGDIDLYPEYSGTALVSVLKRPAVKDPDKAWEIVRKGYLHFGLEWLPPLGFANTYALAVRESEAQKFSWTKVSDLRSRASQVKAGFTSEFLERGDGYPGLVKQYGFRFGKAVDMEPSLMYQAVRDGQVELVSAFSTDGRISAFNLRLLEDDRHFFPPYDCAIVIRSKTLDKFPELRDVLAALSGRLTEPIMQKLNYEVDADGKSPKAVAAEFLATLRGKEKSPDAFASGLGDRPRPGITGP